MELIMFAFAFGLTLFAGIYDLKTSNVHDEIPILLITGGIFYWYLYSLINGNFFYLFGSLGIGLCFSIFAFILYKFKSWGDGDAWILGGLGFCLPDIAAKLLTGTLLVGLVYSVLYKIVVFWIFKRPSEREIYVCDLKEDDVLKGGEVRAMTPEEVSKIRLLGKMVTVQEGVRYTMVFPLTLALLFKL